jgi:tetraacyldisaccharide 4'-kinase
MRLVVVSEGNGPLVGVEESGDEPQLLARQLKGVSVVACADRYQAGLFAERHLGATVHVLDDGFQHLRLARDLDIVLLGAGDAEERVLPSGRLREPLGTIACADAVVLGSDADTRIAALPVALGPEVPVFHLRVHTGRPHGLKPAGTQLAPTHAPLVPPARVVAVAGIARPERFFATLTAAGFDVVATLAFPDHHWFTETECRQIEDTARRTGAAAIVTTEKDAVRLESTVRSSATDAARWEVQPYEVSVEPAERFAEWLTSRLIRNAARGDSRPA